MTVDLWNVVEVEVLELTKITKITKSHGLRSLAIELNPMEAKGRKALMRNSND